MSGNGLTILTGNSNMAFAEAMARYLDVRVGAMSVKHFADGEAFVEIEDNIRGRDVFVVQSTCPPVNDNLMELLIIMDAVKRASSGRLTAVLPYFGYARQDRKVAARTPISAKLVADLLEVAGASRVLTMDLHAGQIQGFFNIPVDHLFFTSAVMPTLRNYVRGDNQVVVSPDAGGVERARHYAKQFGCGLAVIDKRRDAPNVVGEMRIIGDVAGNNAVLLDDLVDTAGTLTKAAAALKENDAQKVYAVCTHAVLSGPAVQRIESSVIDKLIVSDSIPLSAEASACKKIRVVSAAQQLGEAVRRIHNSESVSSLFE
jgi:ribose-phosphate pyrophosphokinase